MFMLPVIAFLLFSLLYLDKKQNMVDSVIVSWLFMTLFIWITTEFLSLFSLINTITIAVSWCLVCIGLIAWGIHTRSFNSIAVRIIKRYKNGEYKYNANLICVVAFCLVIGTIAILRSQRLADNLYHRLPKILHWIQNGNVGYFATSTPEEILYPQLTEYMNMHIYLLRSPDRAITIVQVGAYLSSAVCVYGISKKLKASDRFAWLGAWLFLMVPTVILETMTTQTDVVAGAYLLCFVYFLLDYIQADKLIINKRGAMSAVYLSVSVMFGYLSKPTVCFAMVVFFIWMCIACVVRKDKFMILVQYAAIGGVAALLLVLPSEIRKYQYRHAPDTIEAATDTTDAGLETDTIIASADSVTEAIQDPRIFIAVAIRNLAANSTSRCFPKVNDWIERIVNKCDSLLHYEGDRRFRVMVSDGWGETHEPSPAIMFFCLAAWICIITRLSRVSRLQHIYFICATLALIIQSGLMGYTYYRQRYLIGVMAVLCPAFAVTVEQIKFSIDKKIQIATAMIVISAFGVVNLLTYEIQNVVLGFRGDKLHGYFMSDSESELYYGLMLSYVNDNDYRTVGMSGDISYEYVLWQGIDNLERMEHVNIRQTDLTSAKLEDYDFIPDCIVITKTKDYIAEGDLMECHGQIFSCGWRANNEKGENYAVMVHQ